MIQLRRKNEYGGKGPFMVPADHVPAIRVPKGGSCCQNCMFVDAARHECKEPHYIEWNGSPKLPPLELDEICSDWYDWPGSSEEPEGDCYVWAVDRDGEPMGAPSGPFPREEAQRLARKMAIGGDLRRVVSSGGMPTYPGFAIKATYEARTGRRLS